MRQYKDSGIEWIGRIPENWEVLQVRRIMRNRSERNQPNAMVLSLYRDLGIVPKESRDDNHNVTSEDTASYKVVSKGNFVINKMKAWQGSMAVSEYDGIVSPAYYVCNFTREVHKKYIHYLLRDASYKPEYMRLSTGMRIGQWDLNIDDFLRIKAIIPPLSEQQRIADYLDEKCGEIDSLIGLQEQMIEKLKAYKQSVITEAVTKGLNPRSAPTGTLRSAKNTKLVPSGIDWIGEIPSHWDIIKIGFIFINMDYLREPISAELRERNNPQYDYYGASGIIDKINHYNVEDKVLLIGEDSANLVMRNLPLIYKAEGKFWVNNHAHILKPRKDNYDFMAHALEACNYRDYITTGSAQPKLSQENLSRVQLPVPPLSEQQAIASYLDDKCSEIDNLIAVKQQKIEKLKDYKKSVIYEAITGKTDLRE